MASQDLTDLNFLYPQPLPTPTPSPPHHMYHYPSHPAPPLSLFEQTLLEKEREFYNTFPAARPPDFHDPSQPWRPASIDAEAISGYGFQLAQGAYPSPQDVPSLPQSELMGAIDPSFVHPQPSLHMGQTHEGNHTQYAAPQASPPNSIHDSFLPADPRPLNIVPSAHDISNRTPYDHTSTVMASLEALPSPGASSDPYHIPPHQIPYHPPPPFEAPQDAQIPQSPPLLISAYPTVVMNAVKEHKPHQHFVDPLQQSSSGIPQQSRRGSRDIVRSHPYSRRPGGAIPRPSTQTAWSPSPPHVAPSPNIGAGQFIHTTSASQALSPAPVNAPSVTSPSTTHASSSRRNPEKKPALACVFCRGRKIACGPPSRDGDGKTCNQCERRSLQCEYPTESRRGMRKKPSTSSPTAAASNKTPSSPSTPTSGTSGDNANATMTGNPKPKSEPETPKVGANKKR